MHNLTINRIQVARFFVRLGSHIQPLALLVMKPKDLVEFSRQTYAQPAAIAHWSSPETVAPGLSSEERALLQVLPHKQGRLLLLGLGGGREAVELAKMGFQVTGIDFVPAMVVQAEANAAREGVHLESLVQDITRLDVPAEAYDVAWLSKGMYSCVPTRVRRIAFLQRIRRALKPGGYFLCQFLWVPNSSPSPRGMLIRRLFALLTLGNLSYEPGDVLWLNSEFLHHFQSEDELRSEFAAGGFRVDKLTCAQGWSLAEAALVRE